MNFKDIEVTPGVIIDVNDPEHLGRVKVNAPGLFKGNEPGDHWGVSYTIDNNVLTWIYPFGMNKYQMFSKPVEGAKVWVLNNVKNHNEFWYWPMFEYNDSTEQLVNEKYDNDLEIIMSRKNGDGSSNIYYDNVEGHVTKINDYKINITPSGNILMHGENGDVDIRDGHVYIGNNNDNYEPTVMGDKFKDLLNNIAQVFDKLASSSITSKHPDAGGYFTQLANICRNADIYTQNVSVN